MLSITLNRLGDWPLPIIGGRLRIARNPYQGIFCSRGQKTLKKGGTPLFSVLSKNSKGWEPSSDSQPEHAIELLEFDFGAGFYQLLHSGFSVSFGDGFFNSLGSAVH